MTGDRIRRDGRRSGIVLTVLLVLFGGALVHLVTPQGARVQGVTVPAPDPRRDPAGHADAARSEEVRRRFDDAVVLMHAKRHDEAVAALHRVLELAPRMPEAHVNMGFALIGLDRHKAALDFFESASALAPEQANAYYGMALAYDALGDLPLALGAMRSYLHLARGETEAHLRRARAAIWEWEAALAAKGAPR